MKTMGTIDCSRFNFLWAIFISNLTMIALGNAYAWTSPTLPILMAADSVFPIDQNEATWIASLFSLGAAIGPFCVNPVKNALGFKWAFFTISVLMVISWSALALMWSIYLFYFARILAGIAAGMNFCMMPLYIGEVSEDNLRSALNSLPNFFRCLAFLQEYCVGPFVSYHVLIVVSVFPSVLQIVLTAWLPESPYYLMAKGKKVESMKTVQWLRGGIPQASVEEISAHIQTFLEQTENNKTSSWKDLTTEANLKGLFITITLLCLQQSSGLVVVIMYTKQLFDLTGTNISSSMSSILFGIVYLIGAAVGPILTKKYGFKKPLVFSAIGIFISEAILGTFLYFNAYGYDVSSFFWCPIVCIAAYAITYNAGLGPLPSAITGEIFPANVKGNASAISMSVSLVFGFIISKFFPVLAETLGLYTVFWMFSCTGILLVLVAKFFIPETKGLSLDQIQDLLNKSSKHNKSKQIDIITNQT